MNGKFRVWNKKRKAYHDFEDLVIDMQGRLLDRDRRVLDPKENEVEYCTGLSASKSCRGAKPEDLEIYDNDIISGLAYNQRGLIAWRDGGFGFMYEADTELRKELSGGEKWYDFVPFSGHAYLREILSRFEIIGTIHEAK